MLLRSGVPVVPPELELGTRMMVIAAVDLTFYATVSKAHQLLLYTFSFGDLTYVKGNAEESMRGGIYEWSKSDCLGNSAKPELDW